jgi:hypothetical protein
MGATVEASMDGEPATLAEKVAFLSSPGVFGRLAANARETHMSYVFLTADGVYKLKKLRKPILSEIARGCDTSVATVSRAQPALVKPETLGDSLVGGSVGPMTSSGGAVIVFNIERASASDLVAHDRHELDAIDPARRHLNRVLRGPESPKAAVADYRERHALAQTSRHQEEPYVRIVLSASPIFFRPQDPDAAGTWEEGPRDMKQVWFAGVYCDVGGGYCEPQSGLSKFSLEWMLEEAIASGLAVDRVKLDTGLGRSGATGVAAASADAFMHESLTGWWWIAEIIPKRSPRDGKWRLNLGRRRTVPQGSLVHWSVFARANYTPKLPSNVVRVENLRFGLQD